MNVTIKRVAKRLASRRPHGKERRELRRFLVELFIAQYTQRHRRGIPKIPDRLRW